MPGLLRLLSLGLVLLYKRSTLPPVFFFPRPALKMEYQNSVRTLFFLLLFGVDTAFRRDSRTDPVFTTAVQRENAAETAFRPRSTAGANILIVSEGAETGEPPDSSPPTTPQGTDDTRQPTALVLVASHATPRPLLFQLRLS